MIINIDFSHGQPCSWWTTIMRSTCGRAGGLRAVRAQARPRSTGTRTESVPWRRCCSTVEVWPIRHLMSGLQRYKDRFLTDFLHWGAGNHWFLFSQKRMRGNLPNRIWSTRVWSRSPSPTCFPAGSTERTSPRSLRGSVHSVISPALMAVRHYHSTDHRKPSVFGTL